MKKIVLLSLSSLLSFISCNNSDTEEEYIIPMIAKNQLINASSDVRNLDCHFSEEITNLLRGGVYYYTQFGDNEVKVWLRVAAGLELKWVYDYTYNKENETFIFSNLQVPGVVMENPVGGMFMQNVPYTWYPKEEVVNFFTGEKKTILILSYTTTDFCDGFTHDVRVKN